MMLGGCRYYIKMENLFPYQFIGKAIIFQATDFLWSWKISRFFVLISLNFLYLKKEKNKKKKRMKKKNYHKFFAIRWGFITWMLLWKLSVFAGEFLLLSMHFSYPMAFSSLRFSLPSALEGFFVVVVFVFHRFMT